MSTSENPYQSPETVSEAFGVRSGKRADVRSVAKYQKGIIVCILVYLIGAVVQFALPLRVQIILGLGIGVVVIVGTVYVFLLAIKVYSTALGFLLGILTLIPCVGLIVLLLVNGKATTILRQNGIKVGLLGANLSQI